MTGPGVPAPTGLSSICTTGGTSRVVPVMNACLRCALPRASRRSSTGRPHSPDFEHELAHDAGQQAGADRRPQRASVLHDEEVRLRALREFILLIQHERLGEEIARLAEDLFRRGFSEGGCGAFPEVRASSLEVQALRMGCRPGSVRRSCHFSWRMVDDPTDFRQGCISFPDGQAEGSGCVFKKLVAS